VTEILYLHCIGLPASRAFIRHYASSSPMLPQRLRLENWLVLRVHPTQKRTASVLRRYSLALQLPCHVAKVFFSVIRYHVQSVLQTAPLILHHRHLAPLKICKQIRSYTIFRFTATVTSRHKYGWTNYLIVSGFGCVWWILPMEDLKHHWHPGRAGFGSWPRDHLSWLKCGMVVIRRFTCIPR